MHIYFYIYVYIYIYIYTGDASSTATLGSWLRWVLVGTWALVGPPAPLLAPLGSCWALWALVPPC